MMHAVWPAFLQYISASVMPLLQQEELPPGLEAQPEPPQVPHSRAQQMDPKAMPRLQYSAPGGTGLGADGGDAGGGDAQ